MIIKKCIKCDKNYETNNKNRKYCSKHCSNFKKTRNHPNLVVDYFKEIDTPEKAYWLGFLYADGSINKKTEISYRLTLALSKKDKNTLESFCDIIGADKSKIINSKSQMEKGGKVYESCAIHISDRDFCRELIKNGCIPHKTYRLKFPKLIKNELNLAFLLGFFDGDGTVSETIKPSGAKKHQAKLHCSSYSFLNSIKKVFKVKCKIIQKNNKKRTIKYKKPFFTLTLGTTLYCKMIENYPNSMLRKRYIFKPLKKSSKYPGVSWHKQHEKWYMSYKIGNKRKFGGLFYSEKLAHEEYKRMTNE